MTTSELLQRSFPNAKRCSQGWIAQCPAHEDRTPSLSIREGKDGRVLLHCHAGCSFQSVVAKLGLRSDDLFPPKLLNNLPPRTAMTKPTQTFDWDRCVAGITDAEIAQLASARGYSVALINHLIEMKTIGLIHGDWAFPVHSADGTIVGAHVCTHKGWRYSPKGCTVRPLVLGDLSRANSVWIFESQWDAFSAMDAALWSESLDSIAIVITRGAANGRAVDGLVPSGKPALAFPQNDPIKPDGSSPAINWLRAVTKAAGTPISVVNTPSDFKDLNDWFKSGDVALQFRDAVAQAESPDICALNLGDLKRSTEDDPNELLKRRYLCRGGGLLMIGGTGLGKSSFSMQCMVLWALGRDAFGITPARPMRSLLVQAENDDADLAEMRDGVILGLGLNEEERKIAESSILVFREDSASGDSFCDGVARPLLQRHRPDLLWIDPALAYLGGEAASQKDVGDFLRRGINPLIHEFACGVIIVHHTNKPPAESKSVPSLLVEETAYAGSGSAEWGNWARAALVLRKVKGKSYFQLIAAKRGARIGWYETDGKTKRFSRFIAQANEPDVICWREMEESEIESSKSEAVAPKTQEDLMALVPLDEAIRKNVLLERASAHGIGKQRSKQMIELLLETGKLHTHLRKRSGTNPEILLARFPPPDL